MTGQAAGPATEAEQPSRPGADAPGRQPAACQPTARRPARLSRPSGSRALRASQILAEARDLAARWEATAGALEIRSIHTGLPSVRTSLTAGSGQLRQCELELSQLLDRAEGRWQERGTRAVARNAPEPEALIAAAIDAPAQYFYTDGPDGSGYQARAVLAALSAAGYAVVPAADLEHAQELAAERVRSFPRCPLIKPDRTLDLYVGWSTDILGPVGTWTREEAIAVGCPPSKLNRADASGTSSESGYGRWDADGFAVGRHGFLPRARLADYAAAWAEGRAGDAIGLLERLDDKSRPRRANQPPD